MLSNSRTSALGSFFAVGVALAVLAPSRAPAVEVRIGTGSTEGVYYIVGRAICHFVGQSAPARDIECEAPSTAGSIFNLEALRQGALELAVVQSDWQHHAAQGSDYFADAGPDTELRALFSVHGEPFTVVARRDAAIAHLDDLPGKRVNLGNPGSGQRATMEVVMRAKGWALADFLLAGQLPASQQSLALCHDRVQAMVYTVGHPNASVERAVSLCDAVLVTVDGPEVDELVEKNRYYAHTAIPGGLYVGNPKPVNTFGVKATVVSTTKVDEETVYVLVRAMFENLDALAGIHPAFATLEAEAMSRDGLSAPLHDGAARYYRELGIR